jgi:hypothetical protein
MKHTRSKLRGIVRLIHSFAASCGEFDPPWIKWWRDAASDRIISPGKDGTVAEIARTVLHFMR